MIPARSTSPSPDYAGALQPPGRMAGAPGRPPLNIPAPNIAAPIVAPTIATTAGFQGNQSRLRDISAITWTGPSMDRLVTTSSF
jgi:hypothetical protein